MTAEDAIALSLPFSMALVTQLLNSSVPGYVRRVLPSLMDPDVKLDKDSVQQFVDVSTHIYLQLSFIFAVLLSAVSSLAFTLTSERRLLAAVAVAALVTIVPFWFMKWQGLRANELAGAPGRLMRICGWVTILILWLVTLLARVPTAAAQHGLTR